MKYLILTLMLSVSANAFSSCIENFKYVAGHNKTNLEMKEQVLVSGNVIQQKLILLGAMLHEVTVERRNDNKTKKLIAHQDRMIRILEGQATQEDISHLLKKINKVKKIEKQDLERKLELAVAKENSFCLSTAGDLSDEYENFKKLSRNTNEITYGNVNDLEHMEKAITPKTEEEIIRLILKQ